MVSGKAVEGLEIDPTSSVQECIYCEYAKATHKPIRKVHKTPQAVNFSDEVHSDVWGPSPVKTPGQKEYYGSFTNDHTRWTHLQLLVTKDQVFKAYKSFKAWARLHFGI
jgi:hypothetical protein